VVPERPLSDLTAMDGGNAKRLSGTIFAMAFTAFVHGPGKLLDRLGLTFSMYIRNCPCSQSLFV